MLDTPRTEIRFYVIVAFVLTAAVWAIAQWSVVTESRRQIDESARSAERLAEFFERQTRSIFRYGDSYLKMVRRTFSEDFSVEAVKALMADVPPDSALLSHVTIIGADAVPLFNSGFPVRPGVDVTDRDYFIFHRDRDDASKDMLYVSRPHRGRNSDKLVVRLVRRLSRPDGEFAGVIFAALDAASITEFFRATNLGSNSSATLVGLDKRIRARSSYGRLGPGQEISGSRLWTELARSPQGLYLQTSVVDDITRTYAYRKMDEFPLIVAIGVAVDDIAQRVTDHRIPAYLLALLATAVFVMFVLLTYRQVSANERIRDSESRLRAMHDQLEVRVAERTAELEAVQEELIRAEKLSVLGQLTGTVAHELRNPLSTIDTSLAVLEKRLNPSSDELLRPIERMHRNVIRCNKIISDLLDFARVTRVEPEPTLPDPWLAEVLSELVLPEAVALHFAPGADGAVAALDRDRVRRAVVNLIDNARDAITVSGRPDGVIRVSTRPDAGFVVIEIADNGPGVPADQIERIGEPLFSTKSFGIGLGLSIVDQIATAHRGRFELDSSGGEGARARLWLPLDGDGAAAPPADTGR